MKEEWERKREKRRKGEIKEKDDRKVTKRERIIERNEREGDKTQAHEIQRGREKKINDNKILTRSEFVRQSK